MTRMRLREFEKFLERDSYVCVHCNETERLVPGHRKGRGAGGSKAGEVPSNVVVMCHWLNNAIESDADVAADAEEAGWKLRQWQDPLQAPVWDSHSGSWFLLDDAHGRQVCAGL